jgi:hypothetical protein
VYRLGFFIALYDADRLSPIDHSPRFLPGQERYS